MIKRMIFIVPAAIVGMLAFMALGGLLVMLLWNWIGPTLFGLHAVTFWEAVGLLVLCRILFGRSGLGRGIRNRGAWRRRRPLMWSRLSPEEREEMRRWFWERAAGRPSGPAPGSGTTL